jgi:hypothetical protein
MPLASSGTPILDGICSVCGSSFRLLTSNGTLRKHGHGHGRPPCLGSGRLPAMSSSLPSDLDAPQDLIVEASLDPSPALPASFSFARPRRATVKRIPRGARRPAARSFQSLLSAVVRKPSDLAAWRDLLQFGGCLSQPVRGGGKKTSLATAISTQIENATNDLSALSRGNSTAQGCVRKRARAPKDADAEAARRASIKLDMGDVTGAVRLLCSEEVLAPPGEATLAVLRSKHPPAPADRRPLPLPPSAPPVLSSPFSVRKAIESFTAGSAGGQDGLRPQHLRDMTDAWVGGPLLEVLSSFVNVVLAGDVPEAVRPSFFGASLLAFNKKQGGIRPVAIGLTLRRLCSKIACAAVTERLIPILSPRQLGVGVKGGGEAIVHAARGFLLDLNPEEVLVKLDFTNAFNTVRRDVILEAVAELSPELFHYVSSCYGASSDLCFGDHVLKSAEGVQQGDPLGPLLFCFALQRPLSALNTVFAAGYLDDVTFGGPVNQVLENLACFASDCSSLGLSLNHNKCEVIGLTPLSRPKWNSAGWNFLEVPPESSSILGAPLHSAGVDASIESKCDLLRVASARLPHLSAHESLYLIANSLAIPRLTYSLRSAPCFDSRALRKFDELVESTTSALLNVALEPSERPLLTLPVRWGGLGIRSGSMLAPSCFLSSCASSAELVSRLRPDAGNASAAGALVEGALSCWRNLGGSVTPPPSLSHSQKAWDDPICQHVFDNLLAAADQTGRARLLAGSSLSAGAWLQALPSASLGLRLSDEETRIATGLRLGAPIVRRHSCVCGAPVASNGHHGLACRLSGGRHLRHSLANDVIARAFASADVPVDLEPVGLLRDDGKRPDGVTRLPWAHGRPLVWDFTCPDTLAPSHIIQSSLAAGSAASRAESSKASKYQGLGTGVSFCPFAVETMGTWGPSALDLSSALGARLARVSGDRRATSFLRQRLSIAIQRGNAAAVRGTLPPREDLLPTR